MSDVTIEVQLPEQDATQSVEVANFTATSVASGDVITIENALDNKNNSLVIVAAPTSTAGTLTIEAGDNYPNAILGGLAVAVGVGVNAVLLEDISRFENRDGSVVITAAYDGTMYAVAKRAGVKPV